MDLKIKFLQSQERGNHLIVITGGLIDAEGLEQIFRKIVETTQPLLSCKVLIDLEEAILKLEYGDIHRLVSRFGPDLSPDKIKIALVSSREIDDSNRLRVLSALLQKLGLQVDVFGDAKGAVTWLSETI
jgi:hypothetical protein